MSIYSEISVDLSMYSEAGEIIKKVAPGSISSTHDRRIFRRFRVGTDPIFIQASPTEFGSVVEEFMLINRSGQYSAYLTWKPTGGSLGTQRVYPNTLTVVNRPALDLGYICIVESNGNYADVDLLVIGRGAV